MHHSIARLPELGKYTNQLRESQTENRAAQSVSDRVDASAQRCANRCEVDSKATAPFVLSRSERLCVFDSRLHLKA